MTSLQQKLEFTDHREWSDVPKLKRYIVMGHAQYYPRGGLADIVGSFETIEQAKRFIENDHDAERWSREYYGIYDKRTWEQLLTARVYHDPQ